MASAALPAGQPETYCHSSLATNGCRFPSAICTAMMDAGHDSTRAATSARSRLPTSIGLEAGAALPVNYFTAQLALFEMARVRLGAEVHLLHDVHHRLTPIEAARLGKDLEPYRLFWLEDAVPAENQEAFRLIRAHTTTPLAVGEVFNTIWDAKDLIEEQLIFYTLEQNKGMWRFFDARTYRSGPFDVEYLIGLMEQLI